MPAPARKGVPALLGAGTLCAALLLSGCATPEPAAPARPPAPATAPAGRATDARPDAAARIPGLGPLTRARVPDGTDQVLVVTGATENSNTATAVLHQRTKGRWAATGGPWTVHNALRGWTADHSAGDLRTPIGVYRIGDAGGRLPNPGSRLPYDEDPQFAISGTGFEGEPLEGSFDHVIAIDYNRVPGRTPLDKERPLGAGKGGGVWIHVDHGGPTQACVALHREDLRALLVLLDPAADPVIAMGPAPDLAR
ncbi:L,D-transpeptidase family protein [Streptomyces termitum]